MKYREFSDSYSKNTVENHIIFIDISIKLA